MCTRWLLCAVLFWLPTHGFANEPPAFARQTWDTESGLPQNSVHAIAQTSDGYMWFGTEGGLARFNSIHFTVFNSRNTPQLLSNDIRSLLAEGKRLWVATAKGVDLLDERGVFRSFTAADGLPSNDVASLFQNAAGAPCAVTAAGVACFERTHFEASGASPAAAGVQGAFLNALVGAPILSSFKDREGNWWAGTEATGVTIFRRLEFRTYAESSEHLDDVVRCVFPDKRGGVWMGTNSQGLVHLQNGQATRLDTGNGLASNVIVSLSEDSTGDLFVGTPDGLNRIHNGHIALITSADGLPDDFIRSIHVDKAANVWVGTRRGLSRYYENRFQNFTHSDGLGSDLVGSMVDDGNGTLWIATLKGLTRFSGGKFTNFTSTDGLTNNVITALYLDHEGGLWVGTQGGGLNFYSNGVFHHFPANSGLPEIVYGIAEDGKGDLWLASDLGIFRMNREALAQAQTKFPEVISYGTGDGLRVSECSGGGHPAVAKLEDGSIWFATLKGAAYLQTQSGGNSVAPLVALESIAADERTFNPLEGAQVLPPSPARVSFDYAALSFRAPQKIRFQYKLEGFDKSWINAGAARTAYYTNLGPGAYRFLVKARSGDGLWSEQAAAVSFRVKPQFYQTWWFGLLVAAALAVFVYAIYRWRVVQVKREFNAVLQERNRIAREIHDTLAQGFAGISVQLELVSRQLTTAGEATRSHLDQARMLVRSSLAEARRSIWELRSQSDEMEDLAARLGKMAAQMGGGSAGKVSLQIRGAYRPLKRRLEDELLRIAQEAVTNALRHADAQHIRIDLAFEASILHMTVSDDGKGFAPGVKTTGIEGHFGLQGMRERAEEIGAALSVESAPGKGTTIAIDAPTRAGKMDRGGGK